MLKPNNHQPFTKFFLTVALLVPAAFAVAAEAPQSLSVPDAVVAKLAVHKEASTYIVRMSDDPVVAYDGSIASLKATKPAKGSKINPFSSEVSKYVGHLNSKHNNAVAAVGGKKIYDYYYSFNGFAASLTAAQAATLAAMPGVVKVEKDVLLTLDTNRTPGMLGLSDPGGLWDQLGGFDQAGEGVIVGIIDSGIWPENPSFSDRDKDGKLVFHQIPGWHGRCKPGEKFPASKCNKKLIGAQWYNSGWGGDAGVKATFPYEYASTRDTDGHGSHTSSTAAGNHGVSAEVDGIDLGKISGIAPRARVSMYKVCWGRGTDGGCFGADSVAAIDQAVADGVDVLNFSISGTGTNYLDAVEVAFLFAADAGVFVAASAGNSGPNYFTVAHISPWLTTVAAGTKDDFYQGTVTLGNGNSYNGASRATAISGDMVYAGNAGDNLCALGSLNSAVVAGKIVVCDRGIYARVDKSLAVSMAGGIGMVLANTSANSLNADLHVIPTVHVDHIAGAAIRAYAQGAGATAALDGNDFVSVEAPLVAGFSSRGPNRAGSDLLKPDLMAPGVDILAAVSPAGYGGNNWNFLSGTSMSSPHVAGLGALLTDAHPDWTPAMMKSALMTTATTLTNLGNPIPGDPFQYGSGHVVPNSAVNPGLVYDAGWIDWLGFLCGTGQLNASYCPSISIDPSDLNYPSISIGELGGSQTIVRTVTNVGASGTYDVTVNAPAGIDVLVSPTTMNLAAGASGTFTVTFTANGSVALNNYRYGSLTWSDGVHNVTSPLVIRAVRFAAPTELRTTSGADGSLSFPVGFGYTGAYTAGAHGFVPAATFDGNVVQDPDQGFDPNDGYSQLHLVNVPAGSSFARFKLFDEHTDGTDDLDLYVFNPLGSYIGGSFSGSSAEQFDVLSPLAGDYYVFVHGWLTDGPDSNYTLFTWSLPATPNVGSLIIDSAPVAAVIGTAGTIDLSWAGLDLGLKYLGAVSHATGGTSVRTLINVSTE